MAPPITHSNPDARVKLNVRVRTSTHVANYTVTQEESGTHFDNIGASIEVIFTLPALADGLEYWFHSAVLAQNLVLSPPDSDTLVVFNDIAATQIAFNTTSEIAGGVFHVVCDGTLWHVGEETHHATAGGHQAVIAA